MSVCLFVCSKGEGVAYRGRALVELKTVPTSGGAARSERKQLAKEDKIRIKVTRTQNHNSGTRATV